jgi:hypothetical protein
VAATIEKVVEELNFLTEKLSSLVWTLNVGALGITWTLLITDVPVNFRFSVRNALWVFVPCLLSMLGEIVQYLAGYFSVREACKKIESGAKDFQYDEGDFLHRARRFFFGWKIACALIAAVILLYTLFWKFT